MPRARVAGTKQHEQAMSALGIARLLCVWVAASVAVLPSIGYWDWADPAYARYFIPNILCFIGS